MAITYETSIVCDNCNEMFSEGSETNPMPVRTVIAAQNKGWVVNNNRDLCPECSEKKEKQPA